MSDFIDMTQLTPTAKAQGYLTAREVEAQLGQTMTELLEAPDFPFPTLNMKQGEPCNIWHQKAIAAWRDRRFAEQPLAIAAE